MTMTITTLLNDLLDQYFDELTSMEKEAFARMRSQDFLSLKQKAWIEDAHQRIVPQYLNLASRNVMVRGREVEVLVKDKPLRPPGRRT